jgi:hypothetical protein
MAQLVELNREFWKEAERQIAGKRFHRAYQDSLFFSPSNLNIFSPDLKSNNFSFLGKLEQTGTVLQKSESVPWYFAQLAAMTSLSKLLKGHAGGINSKIVTFRDSHTAKHISESLQYGENSIGFFGLAHQTPKELKKAAPDIQITVLAEPVRKYGDDLLKVSTMYFLRAEGNKSWGKAYNQALPLLREYQKL